jgi:hypothetical protein
MLNDIIEVHPLDHYRVFVRFDDGRAGEVDLAPLLAPFDGVFGPLRDKAYFDQVHVNPDIGTVVWPNGADLCPDVLRNKLTGEALPNPEAAPQPAK